MKLRICLIVFGLAGVFAFASCNRPVQPPPVAGPATGAWITATPNPIAGGTGQGNTTIKWHSGTSTGAVYVGDALFAEGPDGSQDAPWIDLSSKTEFVLFSDHDQKTVLARVTVAGSK